MKITLIKRDYIGLVMGAHRPDKGTKVTLIDMNQKKFDVLKKGIHTIYKIGLKKIIERNYAIGHLNFSTQMKEAAQEMVATFITVNMPPS